ncbi:MAG: acetamidase/formamidase family protein [Candidatus Brocadiia bacterium]
MRRVSREHTVPPEKRCSVLEPVAEVEQGERFVVETINFRTPIIRRPEDANPAAFREREETGPIRVQGIEAGDVLAIHIEDIRPEGHASGGGTEDPDVASFLPIEGGRVHFPGGLSTPLAMMIGDIYVLPEERCPNPWDNGGNMDYRDVRAGNTLCLRAQRDGGLLVLGDLHAAQGWGEVLGLGAECAGEVTLSVTKDEKFLSPRPLLVKPDSFVCIACRDGYDEARDLASEDAARVLARLRDVTEREAYLYVTTVGHLMNGAVWYAGRDHHPPLVVGLEVPLPG